MLSPSLKSASVDGDIERLRKLLKGVGIHEKDEEGFTPLHYAAWAGDLQVVQNLLNLKMDVNCRNNDNKTPLHLACIESRLDSASFLLEKGAEVNARDRVGYSPLHCASEANWGVTGWEGSGGKQRPVVDLVSLLLNKGADPLSLDNFGRTPLDVSTSNQKVKDLLKSAMGQKKRKMEEERRAQSNMSLIQATAPEFESTNTSSPANWSVEQVSQWISSIGFPQYSQIFKEKSINGRFLLNKFDESKLSKLVTDEFHCERIMDEVNELRSNQHRNQEPSNLVFSPSNYEKSIPSNKPARVTFDNNHDGDIRLYWIDTKGEPQLKRFLVSGETYPEDTFIGHVWRFVDDKTNQVKGHIRVSQEVEWFNVDERVSYSHESFEPPSYADIVDNDSDHKRPL